MFVWIPQSLLHPDGDSTSQSLLSCFLSFPRKSSSADALPPILQLRTNILSPLTDAPTIDTRLDAVAELIANHERFRALRKAMRSLERIDADKLTGTILASTSINQGLKMQQRKQLDMAKESERKLRVVLQLRTFLKAIPGIKTALTEEGGCQSNILETISKILADTRLKEIENEIQDTLNENMLKVRSFLSFLLSFPVVM